MPKKMLHGRSYKVIRLQRYELEELGRQRVRQRKNKGAVQAEMKKQRLEMTKVKGFVQLKG